MVAMSARLVSTRCSTFTCPTRTWGSSGQVTSGALAGALIRRVSALISAISSSTDTPRSTVTFSMPRAFILPSNSPSVDPPRGTGRVAHHHLVADDGDGNRRHRFQHARDDVEERADVAVDERVAGRVELRPAQRGGKSAQELVGEGLATETLGHKGR